LRGKERRGTECQSIEKQEYYGKWMLASE
jgi:hypothetical protein